MRGQRQQAMRRWCSQVRRLAILAVALAGFGGEAAAAALDAGQAGASGKAPGPQGAVRPLDTSGGGLFLQGPVGATWGPAGIRMTVAEISNQESASLGFNPGLQLVATTMVPTVAADGLIETIGGASGFYVLGGAGLPPLAPGSQIFNVDTGLLPYTPPPSGCYYVSVALDQDINLLGLIYANFRTLGTGGELDPGGSGYDLFSFGGGDCSAAANGSCVGGLTTLCLERYAGDRRFQIQVSFSSRQGSGIYGDGIAMPLTGLGVGNGGLFSFFGTADPEMLVRVVDACALNSKYWVFLAAATNLAFTVTVTDTVTGHQAAYHNPDLTPAQPVLDTSALACP
jgi:hypothetical protein